MKKQQLSRILMIATIVLLAAFEGYWLNKLYHDEYANLKKEVDVSFRDAMYKLQRRRFEKDTSIVAQNIPIPASYAESAKKILSGQKKDSSKTTTTFIYRTLPKGDPMKDLKPEMIESININAAHKYRGVLPPGLIEVIMKQQAGKHDSAAVFIKMDSAFTMNEDLKEQLKNLPTSGAFKGLFPTVTVRLKKRDNDSTHEQRDTFIQKNGTNLIVTNRRDRREPEMGEDAFKTNHRRGSVFNKVFIGMENTRQSNGPSSPIIRFLSDNKTINDSIPVKVVDSAYRDELSKNNKKLSYAILFKKYANGDARKADFETDSTNEVITSKVFVGFNTPYSYQASFTNTTPFLLKKMSTQIIGSVLLLLFVMISSITMYRSLAAQQRLTAIKNDFIGNITHELKTPIATVNVAIEALRNFGALQSPERTKEYLDISASELQRLGLLVDKVLKLSMFEKQEIAVQKESFDLLQLTEEVAASMKLQFEKQKAVLEIESVGENFMIDADRLHITSVIYNLLDNALKYSKENPQVGVKLIRHEQFFEVRVSDNGIGIAEAYRSKIFEQFFRVPSGNRHNTKGYGLGLSYVNYIVQRHQGYIEVESELGKGSTFIVKLPFAGTDTVQFDKVRKMRIGKFKFS
jgi:signal transduction histidine kinase